MVVVDRGGTTIDDELTCNNFEIHILIKGNYKTLCICVIFIFIYLFIFLS